MREILFRIKDRFDGWYYGYPINSISDKNIVSFVGKDSNGGDYYNALADATTLGQYTGLTDKNDNKIFEGDIVKYKIRRGSDEEDKVLARMGIAEVKFENGEFTPRPHLQECEDYWYEYEYYDFEVIGNKWDNPELLKEIK